MDRIWLKSYPSGVPANINTEVYTSIVEMFDKSSQQFHNSIAVSNFGKALTYQQLQTLSIHFAAYLQQSLGLKKGERFAIMLPNIMQYPVALFGALRAGLVVVNVNPLYTPRELSHQLADSGAKAIIIMSNFAHVLQAALPYTTIEHVIVTELGDLLPWHKAYGLKLYQKYFKRAVPQWHINKAQEFKKIIKLGKQCQLQSVIITAHDIAFLQYTGGTTGVSKGAILTHRNILANVEQVSVWGQAYFTPGKDIIITALPLYHIFSLLANGMLYMKYGAHNVLITNPRDLNDFIKRIKKISFTAISGVNTLFHSLLSHPEFAKLDFSRLRVSLSGGMAVQGDTAQRWLAVTGKPLLEAYGLTEASPAVTICPLTLTNNNGSVGLPLPSTDIMLRDDDGNSVGINRWGEVCVKGPQVMQGYWKKPDETKNVFTDDGWLLTGDIGTIDEFGYLYLVDRKKDMILVSGFNVYPNEVEEVLAAHPDVIEVAVIGVPDPVSGERVKAFVVARDEHITQDKLREYCREKLTAYKVPKEIEFCFALPKNNVGKILRRQLRELEEKTA